MKYSAKRKTAVRIFAKSTRLLQENTPSSISVNSEERKLNAYQKQVYDLVWSGTVGASLDGLVASEAFRDAEPAAREKMVKQLYDYAAEKAKEVLFDDYEIKSSAEKADGMIDAGASAAEWAAWSAGSSGQDRATQYEQVISSDMSDEAKLAAIGSLIGTDMETEAGNPTQWAKLNMAVEDGYSVEEAVGLMQNDELDTYFKWRESDAKRAGIRADVYIDFRGVLSRTTADKDANGKSISGSKKKKVMAYIDGLDLTNAQKDALYYDAGYTQNTIGDAPWHGGEPLGLSLPELDG